MRCQRKGCHGHRSRMIQFDLFVAPGAVAVPTPRWNALPQEVRQALIRLLVQLLLDHVDDARGPREACDDV